MDSLTVQVVVTVVVALAYIVGLTGIIVPVLPGTILIVIATLVWAIIIGGWPAWVAFVIILLLGAAGMTCSYVLTGRRLKANEVPTRPRGAPVRRRGGAAEGLAQGPELRVGVRQGARHRDRH